MLNGLIDLPWWGYIVVALVFIGLGTVIQLVMMNTMIQVSVPNQLRGRVFSIYFWALQGVARFPARIRCATLAWGALDDALRDGRAAER